MAGILVGRLIDGALDTAPYATVILLAVGIVAAAIEGYLAAARALSVIHHDNGS